MSSAQATPSRPAPSSADAGAPSAAVQPSTPVQPSAPAAAPLSAAAAPPAAAPSSPVGTPQPAASTHAPRHPAGRGRRTSRHAARGSFGAHAAPARGGLVGVLASSTSALVPPAAAHSAPHHGTRPAADAHHSAPEDGSTPPLVRTITRIVNVVPLPVRALLGLLLALALALGARSWLAAAKARRLERQRSELLEDVGLLQAALLPVAPERLGPVGTSAAYRPAEGPGAGGDFYDLFALSDGRLAVIVGDVSGHGRQALPHTALVRFTLRAYLEAGLSPRATMQTAGTVLARQLGESFVTVVVAIYHPRKRTLTYACAGHPPPLVVSARTGASIAPVTACASPPIGAGLRTGLRQTTVAVPGDATVCCYTDGVTEARTDGELYGAERLGRALHELGPRATAPQLLERVAASTGARRDDMAACMLNIVGTAAAPAVLVEEFELDDPRTASERAERFLLACGVARSEVPELLSMASAVMSSAGTATLELDMAGERPHGTVRKENVARLHTPPPERPAAVGASR